MRELSVTGKIAKESGKGSIKVIWLIFGDRKLHSFEAQSTAIRLV